MKYLILILFLLTFHSCEKSNVSTYANAESTQVNASLMDVVEEPGAEKAQKNSSGKSDSIAKKIIKNGRMEVQVGDMKNSRSKVEENLRKFNAYIQDEHFENGDSQENLNLVLRVPYKNFEPLVNSFSDGIGSVLSKSISSDDVTEEYTDVSIKLTNKKIYLEKYRELLKRAATTKDMLEIQEKIRGLEDEIDVSTGKLRYIDDKVDFSTLNLTLIKEKARDTVTSRVGFGSRFADSLTQGWNFFVSFFLGVISFWPFFLLLPVVIYVYRKWKHRKKFKKD